MVAEKVAEQRGRAARGLLVLAVVFLILCALVLGGARRLDWPAGWAGIALVIAGLAFHASYVHRHNPGLLERRSRAAPAGARWDRMVVAASQVQTPVLFAVCGLDGSARYPVFPPLPVWLAGVVLWACGQWLVAWAMGTNLFFEGTVRLQEDQGHRVISDGPYRFVRHPGYAGFIVFNAAAPLLFGAPWAALPAACCLAWIIPRIVGEERMLMAQLAGYADYARRVRWRLCPFVF